MIIAQIISTVANLPEGASALQSSISALEIEIAKLDKSSEGLEWWLAGFTLAVLIGVALEIFVVKHDHDEEMEAWHLCELIPKKPSLKKLKLEVASVVLVVLGIFGELAIGLWISHISGRLREKNGLLRSASDQLLALVTQQAGSAEHSAASAEASVKAVGAEADKVKKEVRAVGGAAASIDAQVLATQALLSARMLQNREKLSSELKAKYRGREIILPSYIGDQEAWGLCTQLWHVAKDAEMNPKDECGTAPLTVPLASPGTISGPDVDETVRLSGLITSIGKLGFWSGVKAPVLTIFVGKKMDFVISQARGVPVKKQKSKATAKP